MSRRSKQQTSSSNCSSSSSTSNLNYFNDDDRQQLYEIHSTVKPLAEDLTNLKEELEISKNEVKQVKTKNTRLKQALNTTNYKLDELEQYGRRENLRIYGILDQSINHSIYFTVNNSKVTVRTEYQKRKKKKWFLTAWRQRIDLSVSKSAAPRLVKEKKTNS